MSKYGKLSDIKQDSRCFPAQWEAKLEDGRCVYIRFRFGGVGVWISRDISDDIRDAINGELAFSKDVRGGMDGCMETDEMIEIIKEAELFDI